MRGKQSRVLRCAKGRGSSRPAAESAENWSREPRAQRIFDGVVLCSIGQAEAECMTFS